MGSSRSGWGGVAVLAGAASWGCGEASRAAVRTSETEAAEVAPAAPAAPVTPGVAEAASVFLCDLPELVEARRLRVLVPYAPPYFFFEGAEPRGLTFEMFREYGRFVEEREGLRRGELDVVYVPCELDAVVAWLEAGYGDVAGGALAVTPGRAARVAFAAPLVEDVDEIVAASSAQPAPASLDDLAGREVWVAAGSSYEENLARRSAELVARGLPPVAIHRAPPALSTEDLLEMAHAGIVPYLVADDYKAELWSGVLPGLRLHPELVVHAGDALAWAVRPDAPELRASLDAFAGEARRGTLLGNVLMKRYLGSTRWIEDPGASPGRAHFERHVDLLRELADEHDFDWLRLAAQCFQESGFDPAAVSPAGAVGLMQLLPATARDMGCDDPRDPEQNLRAGVRYLAWLRSTYFDGEGLDEHERTCFVLAAYNAGPGNVRKWRAQAPGRGLDPDRWRGHVERLALEHVGVQPVRYVDNIEKYYVAYTLAHGLEEQRARYRRPR